MVSSVAKGRTAHSEPDYIARAEALAEGFATRAAAHDRDGRLRSRTLPIFRGKGLLALTVPAALSVDSGRGRPR